MLLQYEEKVQKVATPTLERVRAGYRFHQEAGVQRKPHRLVVLDARGQSRAKLVLSQLKVRTEVG